ncbi:MAG TPA: dihydrolipoamide acetyltransferase family protein [Solirubrobacteraceae bacterium]|nr:dihydrolipoamide acetyltransferase family protein [Solirubrobacteraceae bacterium]
MSSSPTDGGLIDVTMPQMGVSVAEGTVVQWRVAVGERIEADQPICEISTDKIDTEVPAPAAGVLEEVLVPVDTTVAVGTVLARLRAVEADARASAQAAHGPGGAAVDAPGAGTARAPQPGPAHAPQPGTAHAPQPGPADGSQPGRADAPGAGPAEGPPAAAANGSRRGGLRHSPVVRRIAAEHGIDLAAVRGSGRGGRVRKQDVLALVRAGDAEGGARPAAGEPGAYEEPPLHIESPYRPELAPAQATAQPAPTATTVTPAPVAAPGGGLSRMRRQIGEHMKRSLETAATCTTWIEADMSRVESARRRLGVTALAFVARATIDALREHPALNAWMEGERYTRLREVNLGIAVSLGEDGLIVPVIHGAHELSVEGLAARIRDLAARARARQLTPDEVRGGTFTITNPGQYGSIMATPIINQPQVAILDFEAVVKRPVVVSDAEGNDSIAIRPMTILGLSWDHRALDGALAAQFLASVRRGLEEVAR